MYLDTLHNASNHGYETIDVVLRFVRAKNLRIELCEEIKILISLPLELPQKIPENAEEIRGCFSCYLHYS